MFNDPYCSVIEADEVNTSDAWVALTDDEKLVTLKWARLYLDANYECNATGDDFEAARKIANALLGQHHVTKNLFEAQNPGNDALLIEKNVKAGSVTVGKKYQSESKSFDKYPDASAALSGFCEKISTAFKIRNVVRH